MGVHRLKTDLPRRHTMNGDHLRGVKIPARLKDEGAAADLQRIQQGSVNDTDIFHGSQLLLFGFFLRRISAVQRLQPMPHPLDAHAFHPRGFRQTAPVQTVADQKSLLFIRKEKQVVQQQSCPKCIKGGVRRRMRSLIGKLMALPPLLLTPEGIQAASMILVIVPILCIYPFVQKHFVKGVMIGSIKG